MARRMLYLFVVAAVVFGLAMPVLAQQTAVRGNLAGTVYDKSGAVIPDAQVTVTGPLETRTTTTDGEGRFNVPALTPGRYSVKVEKQGFRAADLRQVEVVIGRTSTVRLDLEPGVATEVVEVTATGTSVDSTSTAVSTNLTNEFYENIPMPRGVASIFYAAAGVTSGIGTGQQNPSISGGSGLENNYIADGVQINDAAFGGLGVYSRVFGSIGTGVNLSFIKEVQVKTAGFEPQYGKSTGGVVQIVTKSGTRDYHGGISGFAGPEWGEFERLHPDDFGRINKFGKRLHERSYDVTADLSGYIPGFRDNLFFYGSYNPSWTKSSNAPIAGSIAVANGLIGPEFERRRFSNNYAGKLTLKLNDSNTIEGSIFGDPTKSNSTGWRNRTFASNTSFSSHEFQGRNIVGRYNGTLSPTWLLNASYTWNHNDFTEIPEFPNVYGVADETEIGGLPGQRGAFQRQGIGFTENYDSNNYGFNVDTSKIANTGPGGSHTLTLGYSYGQPNYDNIRERTGPRFALITTNREGDDLTDATNPAGIPSEFIGALTDAQFRLRIRAACTVCPLLNVPGLGLTPVAFQQNRGEFGSPVAETKGVTHIGFFNDNWSVNKFITLNLGARWEQQRLEGTAFGYTFKGEWSPRIGVIVDPWGDRRSKVYANFSRYFFHIPLDMAIRSLSAEQDAINYWFAAVDANGDGIADLDALGNPQPNISVAGVLNSVTGAGGTAAVPSVSTQVGGGIASGTRMQYTDEWSAGFERDMGAGVILGVRYVDRRLKRIVEDIAGVSPEGFNAGLTQNYFITNTNATTDLYVNEQPITFAAGTAPPVECGAGPVLDPVEDSSLNVLGAVCFPETLPGSGLFGGEIGADGLVDGFPDPQRIYRAVEIEINKGFTAGWLLRANWRIADLKGNYEGAFRNDNGQSDPSISSLFDFVQGTFGLLGEQFAIGPLNTDRRHTINGFASYTFTTGFLNNFTIGTGVRVQSGFPLSELGAHPSYQNRGEIPIGGRGALGRSAVTTQTDFNFAYVARVTEKQSLRFGMDLFNVGNRRTLLLFDQNRDVAFGSPNGDFRKPGDFTSLGADSFQRSFYSRFNIKWEF